MSTLLQLLPVFLLSWLAQPLQQAGTFRASVDAVRVDVLVTESGRPVPGLVPSDFEVFDNGVRQRIDQFVSEEVPLNLLLALDTSSSIQGQRAMRLRAASRGVLDRLRPQEQSALVTFSEAILVPQDLTSDRTAIRRALEQPLPIGSTSLADACYTALVLADSQPGRSLVLVFTDGVDVSSYLNPDAVLEAAKRSDAVIYGVTVKGMGRSDFMRSLATASGGEVFEAESSETLDKTFARVLEQFRSRYLFSYTPQGVERRGWHRLEVRVKRPGAAVNSRPGYIRE
jgi:VWFA-related protein